MSVLIHIGYPRAGSTYIQTWFSQHPSFHYYYNSIAGFSDLLEMAKYAQKTNNVHDYFVVSCEDLSIWKGEIDIVGLKPVKYNINNYQQKISKTLNRIFPNAKVLIVTRGFSSIITSIYAQYLVSGGTFIFEDFMKKVGPMLQQFCNYTYIVNSYKELFGEENLIVLPYELLKENPKLFISVIEERLGLSESINFTIEKINSSMDNRLLSAHLKFSIFLSSIISPFPYRFQKIIYSYYILKLNQQKPHPIIKALSRFVKTDMNTIVNEETLKLFSGNAEVFRNDKLFEPYLKKYLL